jgi:hypothetical protein
MSSTRPDVKTYTTTCFGIFVLPMSISGLRNQEVHNTSLCVRISYAEKCYVVVPYTMTYDRHTPSTSTTYVCIKLNYLPYAYAYAYAYNRMYKTTPPPLYDNATYAQNTSCHIVTYYELRVRLQVLVPGAIVQTAVCTRKRMHIHTAYSPYTTYHIWTYMIAISRIFVLTIDHTAISGLETNQECPFVRVGKPGWNREVRTQSYYQLTSTEEYKVQGTSSSCMHTWLCMHTYNLCFGPFDTSGLLNHLSGFTYSTTKRATYSRSGLRIYPLQYRFVLYMYIYMYIHVILQLFHIDNVLYMLCRTSMHTI